MQIAGKSGAGGGWDPKIGRSSIEDNIKILGWSSDRNRSEILSSHVVFDLNLRPSWVGAGSNDLGYELLQSFSDLVVESSQEVGLQDLLLLGEFLFLELDFLDSGGTDQQNSNQ